MRPSFGFSMLSVPMVKSPTILSAPRRKPTTSRVEALPPFLIANSTKGLLTLALVLARSPEKTGLPLSSRLVFKPLNARLEISISQPLVFPILLFVPPQPSCKVLILMFSSIKASILSLWKLIPCDES